MKKIDKPLSRNYLPVKLYLDDLSNIENIINEFSDSIVIKTEDFQFSSIEELSNELNNHRITTLTIETPDPYTRIELHQLWTRIYVASRNKLGAALFFKLDELLKKTRRPLWFLYSYYFLWTLVLFTLTVFILVNYIKQLEWLPVLFIIWGIWVLFVRGKRHSLIIVAKNNGFRNLWIRKKDDIILVIIAAFIGSILGVIGTLLVNHFIK